VARPRSGRGATRRFSADQRAEPAGGSVDAGREAQPSAGASSDHTGQTAAVDRVGLRSAYITDDGVAVKQGNSTALPIPIGLAATFDPGMATLAGKVVADEAKHKGNDVILGPTVNIMRTPLGGRTFEADGEDPFLVASTAVSWIEAAQSQEWSDEVKHFWLATTRRPAGTARGERTTAAQTSTRRNASRDLSAPRSRRPSRRRTRAWSCAPTTASTAIGHARTATC